MIVKFSKYIKESNLPETKKDYFLVNLNGTVMFNVEGILDCIKSKKIFEYPCLPTYSTLMDPKYYMKSILYHGLGTMISKCSETNGWYNAEWREKLGDYDYHGKIDMLYYDEFCFLAAEDLIKFDSYECKTHEDIWRNVGVDINKDRRTFLEKHPEIKPLYDSKNLIELKNEYRKLVKRWHPDKIGENDVIRYVTDTFFKLKKKFIAN
jgi:hypothetical protein